MLGHYIHPQVVCSNRFAVGFQQLPKMLGFEIKNTENAFTLDSAFA